MRSLYNTLPRLCNCGDLLHGILPVQLRINNVLPSSHLDSVVCLGQLPITHYEPYPLYFCVSLSEHAVPNGNFSSTRIQELCPQCLQALRVVAQLFEAFVDSLYVECSIEHNRTYVHYDELQNAPWRPLSLKQIFHIHFLIHSEKRKQCAIRLLAQGKARAVTQAHHPIQSALRCGHL